MPFISCKQVVRAYKVDNHEIVALRGIDFTMEKGEMVAIIGPSGAGKSSLLNLLGGLDKPTAGQLIVDGQSLLELKGRALAHYRLERVGFVWQEVEKNLLFHRSALGNVTLPMMLAGVSPFTRRKQARELLDAVDLLEHINKKPSQLSGGQQQRVAIAVALANKPQLLLADEPTGALDGKTAVAVMDLLMDLRERYGLTILMVTHDMKMAQYADRVLTLRDGALGQNMSDEDASPHLDEDGRLQLPQNVRTTLKEAPYIAVEIRPEGVLLRPEHEDEDHTDALLSDMLPQDAAPDRRGLFGRMRRLLGRKDRAS
ncbi:ABC transporter ATP-binding protein [Phototrophicus methaneseepsis]|uniref:ABC transporter ATP-binding protein n=1 Tax=Phototrophicus methaneseepsis TaxID=2710758 RepID=A0A7S8IGH2_9CHLR|nr:ABC transporter ATP-binding protein [Phototrophicus methaneseepsis]QPC83998.1 ABC transporter ATP-binding protein [Phototrophicus methaneseepsis]